MAKSSKTVTNGPSGLTAELARALVELYSDEDMQARFQELNLKWKQGALTPAEEEEFASFVNGNTLVGMLKAEAASVLARNRFA